MKYYFPTTTLNFDSILSSQMISPSGVYKPGTLWWNRHKAIIGERPDVIVLYSRCPVWDINDPDCDNYPMVVELNKSFAKADKIECGVNQTIKATCLFESFTFSMLELMQGKVRFLFRDKSERDRMLVRAMTGVEECKIVNALKIDCPEAFDLMPTKRNRIFKLDEAQEAVAVALEKRPLQEKLEYGENLIRAERVRGARLGYQAGRNAKFLRNGFYMDAYRDPVSYDDWKKKVIPEPFSALIDKLSARPLVIWDPNRVAIAQFCKECWDDCFRGKKVTGKTVREGTKIHASLQNLARHWLSPAEPYRISAESNPYLQAFAAFLECGDNAGKYPRFAKEGLLKQPEYLLCLYGALVGYTSFSRILLENKMYLPAPLKPEDKTPSASAPAEDMAPDKALNELPAAEMRVTPQQLSLEI